MDEEQLTGKWVVGEFVEKDIAELTEVMEKRVN